MTHTLTVEGLDDFEAEHISSILHEYKSKILCDITKAMVEDMQNENDNRRTKWYEEHLEWHENVMKKVKWTKE